MFFKVKRCVKAYLKNKYHLYSMSPSAVLDPSADVLHALKQAGLVVHKVMDVGAARGEWTRGCLAVFPGASCMMVDPLIENEESLRNVVNDYPKSNYWIGAIGDASGELKIHAHGDQSSLLASEWGGETRTVQVRTLDSFLDGRSCEKIDVLKVDVQGAELSVFRGASKLLEGCSVIQVEVGFRKVYEGSASAHEVVAFLGAFGFRIYDICDVIKRDDRALLQCDMFFVKDGPLFSPETWYR